MKALLIITSLYFCVLCFSSCSKDKDCVCVYTQKEYGVVTKDSTSTTPRGSVPLGPNGDEVEGDDWCDKNDSYTSVPYNGDIIYEERTECELN